MKFAEKEGKQNVSEVACQRQKQEWPKGRDRNDSLRSKKDGHYCQKMIAD